MEPACVQGSCSPPRPASLLQMTSTLQSEPPPWQPVAHDCLPPALSTQRVWALKAQKDRPAGKHPTYQALAQAALRTVLEQSNLRAKCTLLVLMPLLQPRSKTITSYPKSGRELLQRFKCNEAQSCFKPQSHI